MINLLPIFVTSCVHEELYFFESWIHCITYWQVKVRVQWQGFISNLICLNALWASNSKDILWSAFPIFRQTFWWLRLCDLWRTWKLYQKSETEGAFHLHSESRFSAVCNLITVVEWKEEKGELWLKDQEWSSWGPNHKPMPQEDFIQAITQWNPSLSFSASQSHC